MPTTKLPVILILFAVAASTQTSAQSLDKRHQIEFRLGGWSQVTDSRTAVSPSGVTTTVNSKGFIGGLAYGHWLQEDLAFRISAGIMAASMDVGASVTGVDTEFAAVLPFMVGMRYYLPKSTREEQFRPFLGVNAGTFVGGQEITHTGLTVVVESRTEVAFGGEFEAGVGILLSRKVMATVAMAYNLMTDFEHPIGGSSNYSGPQMTLGISLLMGGATN